MTQRISELFAKLGAKPVDATPRWIGEPCPHGCPCEEKPRPPRQCRVIREARLALTPEGRKTLKAEYDAECEARIEAAKRGKDEADVRHLLQSRCNVPLEVLLAMGGELRPLVTMQAANRYLEKAEFPHLFLCGVRGCGKSVAAAHVLAHRAKRHVWNAGPSGGGPTEPFLWIDARDLAGVGEFREGDQPLLRSLRLARTLVVDDVGDEGTNYGRDLIANLLLDRHAERRQTVVTSNLTAEAFKARYGAALYDRLVTSAVAPDLSAEESHRRKRSPANADKTSPEGA